MAQHSVSYSPRPSAPSLRKIDASEIKVLDIDEYKARHQRLWQRGIVAREPDPEPSPVVGRYRLAFSSDDVAIQIPLICRKIESRRDATMEILKEVASAHAVRLSDMLGPCRVKKVVDARFEAMFRVAAERPEMSLPAIGTLFSRDHTSVIHALKTYAARNGLPKLVRK